MIASQHALGWRKHPQLQAPEMKRTASQSHAPAQPKRALPRSASNRRQPRDASALDPTIISAGGEATPSFPLRISRARSLGPRPWARLRANALGAPHAPFVPRTTTIHIVVICRRVLPPDPRWTPSEALVRSLPTAPAFFS
ncbi:uncharacterized protein K452DRAFT_134832 [Aplosporella prunicola CBS 121167]|uniref:Uncharacterized protein n=1 Tax=Aplosporella prunicola CBS 121167 TaxID=1176127 RepID=A0A6A6BPF5_9PEZI|nr:uncharacterized protein K452DRAFT_134832 [Aplosporella prunicola CBS 121167]KAF2145114.1 hypothetical protein K452DRAFT_134832 [Aplosporella prunicola CBS 121167]